MVNTREFSLIGITVGRILEELQEEVQSLERYGIYVKKMTRPTFYRLRDKLGFPPEHKTAGGWRVYTREEAELIKTLIKKNYRLDEKPKETEQKESTVPPVI